MSFTETSGIPFSHVFLIERHEKSILFDLSRFIQLLDQELDKFWFAVLWDHRQPVNHDERV